MKIALAAVALFLAGAGGEVVSVPSPSPSIADAWSRLDHTRNTCNEKALGYDYWPQGGIRNFWCRTKSVLPWDVFVKLAPMKIWLKGPHGQWRAGKLSLHDPHDFGRYNPAFVHWLVDNAVPAATDEALRAKTQPMYDSYVRELARTYYAVHQKMDANPKWKSTERTRYLRAMDEKNPDWASFYDKYSEFMSAHGLEETKPGEYSGEWGAFDPNLQSASVAFWLRRDIDGTAPIFFEGLTKLLQTYDAAWLKHPHSADATPGGEPSLRPQE